MARKGGIIADLTTPSSWVDAVKSRSSLMAFSNGQSPSVFPGDCLCSVLSELVLTHMQSSGTASAASSGKDS